MTLLPILTFIVSLATDLPEDRVQVIIEVNIGIIETESDDTDQRILALTALSESGYRGDVVHCKTLGDHGRAFGAFQIHPRSYDEQKAACDPRRAAGLALSRILESRHMCASYPEEYQLAAYASGSCGNRAGQRISRERFKKAKSE